MWLAKTLKFTTTVRVLTLRDTGAESFYYFEERSHPSLKIKRGVWGEL
jgi:hypothetical protein